MNKQNIAGALIALMVEDAFASSVLRAGSDVARYPMSYTYSSGTMLEPHCTIGVPAPRVRAFVNAPWTGATHHGAALIWRIAARGWAEAHKPFLPSTPGRALNGGHADALPTIQRLASLMPAQIRDG
jgi:hypothetical protein